MGSRFSRRKDPQKSAPAKSSSLPGIVTDLPINRSIPPYDYIQKLIKQFRESPSPECMRRVVFSPDKALREYVSASYHLPGAYVDFFPCQCCTYNDEEEHTSFVEVFHFASVHKSDVCATVTFVMPADARRPMEPSGCSVEVEYTKGCPNAPLAVDRSPRVVLHIATDVFIEVLRFLPRSELEKTMLVSRGWSNIIGGAEGSLQQRRSFSMDINFYGESPGMLSIRFDNEVRLGEWRTLRVLTTRGVSQALKAVRSHLRNAFVEGVLPDFLDSVPSPLPPRDMLVDISLRGRTAWLESLLISMPPNSEIGAWCIFDNLVGLDNLLSLALCASGSRKKLDCAQRLELALRSSDATWAELAGLLGQPRVRGFGEIAIAATRAAIDTSELRTILSSWQLLKLHIIVSSDVGPQNTLLTLPAQIIRDFLALRDVNRFVAEVWLHLQKPDNIAFSEIPDVDEPTDRWKRFRYHLQGKDTEVRVRVYENPTARECLSVVTFAHFRRTVLFLNGNMSLTKLKQVFQRPCTFY